MALAMMAGAFACSPQGVPRNTVRRIREADRAIVTYSGFAGEIVKPLAAEETKKLVQAISTARKEDPARSCAVSLQVEFFKGTNTLRKLLVSHAHADGFGFGIDGSVYLDTSGTLKAIGARFDERLAETH
jgi:hypothetical protein